MWIAFVKLLKVFAWPDVRKMRRWWFSHTASRGSEIINNSRKFAPSFAGNPATQISHFSCFTNTHNTVTAIIETMTPALMILLGCSRVEGWLQWLCQNELFLVLVWPITVHVKWSIFEEFSRSIGEEMENDEQQSLRRIQFNFSLLPSPLLQNSPKVCAGWFQDKAAVDYTWVSIQNFQQHPSCLILSIIHSVFSYRRNFQHTPKFCFWLRCG